MQVLHVAAGNLYGGIERLLATLARQAGLCPAIEPHFALCFEGLLSRQLCGAGATIHLLGGARVSRPWTVWRARRRLDMLLGQKRFAVVICHECWPYALFAPVMEGRRLPLVFWAHALHDGKHWLERWAGRTEPSLVLANSRLTQSTLPNLFPGARNEVLYLPVEPPHVRNRDLVRQQVRQALRTPADATVIIQASRLEPWKGQVCLLQALGRLKNLSDWVCWIVGGIQRPCDNLYLEELQARAASMGIGKRVRFVGQRSDVPQLLAAADIFCQPNIGPEPFGLVFVEALYAGLPVVTSAVGGALEIVDNTCGVLVPPGETGVLSEILRELIQDKNLRTRLGAAGPARARGLCDLTTRMGRLRELLAAVAHQDLTAAERQ